MREGGDAVAGRTSREDLLGRNLAGLEDEAVRHSRSGVGHCGRREQQQGCNRQGRHGSNSSHGHLAGGASRLAALPEE